MKLSFDLYPHQRKVWDSTKEIIAIGGGIASGKSFACLLRLVKHIINNPGTQTAIVRNTIVEVKRTIIEQVTTHFSPLVKNIAGNTIEWKNGATTLLLNGWDGGIGHLQGISLSAFILEEAALVRKEVWDELCRRTRRPASEILKLLTFNPMSKNNWLYRESFEKFDEVAKSSIIDNKEFKWKEYEDDRHLSILVPTDKYDFLPEGFVDSIKEQADLSSNVVKDRFFKGEFSEEGGLVWNFKEERNVIKEFNIKKDIPQHYKLILSQDYGVRHPHGALLILWNSKEDFYYVIKEYRESNRDSTENAEAIIKWAGELWQRIDIFLGDPAGRGRDIASNIAPAVVMEGIWQSEITNGINSVDEGKQMVQRYLAQGRIQIFDSCPMLIEEIKEYRYKDMVDVIDKPLSNNIYKVKDDLCDCLRLGVASQELYKDIEPEDYDRLYKELNSNKKVV